MSKCTARCGVITVLALAAGCAQMPTRESDSLSDVARLTTGFDRAGGASFSSDLKWVIFQATPRGESQDQIYVARLIAPKQGSDGKISLGRPVRITPSPSRNTSGFFSPDGESIIFASSAGREPEVGKEESPNSDAHSPGSDRRAFASTLEIFRADNWKPAMQTAEEEARFNFAKHALTRNQAHDAECSYSPDGRYIVFASDREPNATNGEPDMDLYVMHADGSRVVRLINTPGYDGGAFFSPDGKRLAYRSERKGNDLLQIFVADLVFGSDGDITGLANERQLTSDERVEWGPFWHPSGDYIIYASSSTGQHNHELYLIRTDGKRFCRITFASSFDGSPVFSPDGNYLMWSSNRTADDTTQIFAARFKLPDYLKRAD
jgi:TolB protein